ncbi:MAG: hypothetical protein R6U38_05645, partial [Desulfatiglandaceae bacterium]
MFGQKDKKISSFFVVIDLCQFITLSGRVKGIWSRFFMPARIGSVTSDKPTTLTHLIKGEKAMFCFQCQETAKNQGCTVKGMCGKPEE